MDESASTPCPAAQAIIDCPDPYKPSQRNRRIGLLVGFGMFGIALGASLLAALWPTGPLPVATFIPWFLVIVVLSLVLGRAYMGGRKSDAFKGEMLDPLSDDAVIAMCAPKFWDTGTGMGPMTKRLHHQGVVGSCIRICHVDSRFAVEPLTLPFEPIPLDQAETGFANLLEQPGSREPRSADSSPSGETSSKVNRNILFAGGKLSVAIFGFVWLMHLVEALMKWRVTWPFIYWSIFFGVMLFGFGGRGAWTWRRQWLLVPGGVFTRTAKFFQQNWQTHLFKRSDSTLVLRNTQRNIWTACVFDGASLARAGMTQKEAQVLLRAWLCPLPTPPVERLSDLM